MADALDASERLLVRLSRVRPEPEPATAEELAAVDWPRFLLVAARLANFNLIASRLVGLPEHPALPSDVRRRLARNLAWFELRERLLLADVGALAGALAGRGEPLLLLKGGAYALGVYPRPGLRSYNDLDVLVRPEAVDRALAALAALGYKVHHRIEGSIELVRRDPRGGFPLAVELHTGLVHHHEYPYYREELAFDERRLLDRSEERRVEGGGVVRVLRAEDELLYAVLHFFFHHDLRGLKYHSDLNALLTDPARPIDLGAAAEVAEQARAGLAVGLALLVNERLFGQGAVPATLLARLAPRGLRLRALRATLPPLARLALEEGRVAGHPTKVLTAPGIAGPLHLAARRLFPGRRYLMALYGLDERAWRGVYHLRYLAAALGRGLRRGTLAPGGSREA